MAGIYPFYGEIMIVAFGFAPYQFRLCNGDILPIQQYSALFSILGTTYGGNGTSNFALPNFQGRVPVGMGALQGGDTYALGELAGEQSVTLLTNEMPAHQHQLPEIRTNKATSELSSNPIDKVHAQTSQNLYSTTTNSGKTTPQTIKVDPLSFIGGSVPHNNMQPYLVLNFCIALVGVYPSRN